MLTCSARLSSTTSSRLRRGVANALIRDSATSSAIGGGGLADERERAARQAVLAVLVERHDLDRDVPRRGIALQLTQHGPSEHVGQEHVERYRGRPVLAHEIERVARPCRRPAP